MLHEKRIIKICYCLPIFSYKGTAWQTRRRMLSTTFFNFSAQESYLTVFNEQSFALVRELKETLRKSNNKNNVFNIHPYMTKYTLNIICGKFFRYTIIFVLI